MLALPSQQELREYFEYRQDGVLLWKKATATQHLCKIGTPAGHGRGYNDVQFKGKKYKAHRLIWKYHHGIDPVAQIDHINRDRLDNRIENLRDVSQSENMLNTRVQHRSSELKPSRFYLN